MDTLSSGKNYAKLYDESNETNGRPSKTEAILPAILDRMPWKQGEIWMDHGCGSGQQSHLHLTPRAERTSSKLYGVDISEAMVQVAKELYAHPRVEYVHGDLLASEFSLNHLRFDKIFSAFALRLIAKQEETLAKFFDVLKPGGQLVILNVVEGPLLKLRSWLKLHPEVGPFLGPHLADPHWYPAPPGTKPPRAEVSQYHVGQYVDKLTSLGFVVHECFTVECVEPFDIKEGAEFAIAADPEPHEAYFAAGGDPIRLEALIREYLAEECNADKSGATKHEHQLMIVCVRAEKPGKGKCVRK